MPQLSVVNPSQGSAPLQQTDRSAFGATGSALANVGSGFQELGSALGKVAEYRAEAAAVNVDQRLQELQLEIQENPNRLLDDEWKADYDQRYRQILQEEGSTPFIHRGVFERRSRLARENRELQLDSNAIQVRARSGRAALTSVLQDYSDKMARSKDEDERAVYEVMIESEARGAVNNGILLEGEAALVIEEAKKEGFTGAFMLLNNNDPVRAFEFVQRNAHKMTAKEEATFTQAAIAKASENMRLEWARRRNYRQEAEFAMKVNDRETFRSAANAIVAGDYDLTDLILDAPNMSGEHSMSLYKFLVNEPRGGAARTDDPRALIDATNLVNRRAQPPDGKTVPDALAEMLVGGMITPQTYATKINEYESRQVNPIRSLMEKSVLQVTLLAPDKAPNAMRALTEFNEWMAENPSAKPREIAMAALSITRQFDVFNLRDMVETQRPDYFKFVNDRFDLQASLDFVADEVTAGRMSEQSGKDATARLMMYVDELKIQQQIESAAGQQE